MTNSCRPSSLVTLAICACADAEKHAIIAKMKPAGIVERLYITLGKAN